MAKILDVYICEKLAGYLKQNNQGKLSFQYDKNYLELMDSTQLSISLPLGNNEFKDRTARPFFSGLLPDGDARKFIAKILGVSANNPFSILYEIGFDCAGAVMLLPSGEIPADYSKAEYKSMSTPELLKAIDSLPRHPLLADNQKMRLSLAGVQNKLAVFIGNDVISFVYGAPTTHIIKPQIAEFEDTVNNEFFCMLLAKRLGLNVAEVSVRNLQNQNILLVERFDRQKSKDGTIQRLHQEDFCQSLSIPPELKYEREGGPSIKKCLELIEQNCRYPAREQISFIRCIIFNFLIGNADAHGKNFSFLYRDGDIILAPFYDLISTTAYPELDTKMSMKIGSKYKPKDVQLRHWHQLASAQATAKINLENELKDITGKITSYSQELQKELSQTGSDSLIYAKIHKVIVNRCKLIQKQLEAK